MIRIIQCQVCDRFRWQRFTKRLPSEVKLLCRRFSLGDTSQFMCVICCLHLLLFPPILPVKMRRSNIPLLELFFCDSSDKACKNICHKIKFSFFFFKSGCSLHTGSDINFHTHNHTNNMLHYVQGVSLAGMEFPLYLSPAHRRHKTSTFYLKWT